MKTIYLEPTDPTVERIVNAAFGRVSSRKREVVVTDTVSFMDTQWSGGTRSVYRVVRLRDLSAVPVAEAPFLRASELHTKPHSIPAGYVVVEHRTFCGKDRGYILWARADDINPLLPKPDDIPEDVVTVCKYTRAYKNTYGGQTDLRYREAHLGTGITRDRWDSAKGEAQRRKLLNRAGAITVAGRNVAND